MTRSVGPTALKAHRFSGGWTAALKPFIPAISRVLTLFAALVLVGLLPWLTGRDPAMSILRARSGEQEATPEALGAIRAQLGLDQGPTSYLLGWFRGLMNGDAGISWISGAPILPGMLNAAGVSLTLTGAALVVALPLVCLLCLPVIRSGLRGEVSLSSGTLAAVFTAVPEFLLSTLLLVVFAVWLPWFAPYGWTGWQDAVLPAIAMGIPAGGLLGRLFSNALAETFNERWVATWSVAGFSRRRILLAVLGRALPGLLPQVGMVMIGLTGGAVAVEQVFSIPGLGRATIGAASAQDLPALQTGILLMLLIAVALGSLANVTSGYLLGPALRSGALPVATTKKVVSRSAFIIPATIMIMLIALIAFGLPRDPFTSAYLRLQPPSFALPLGADGMGRDVLARIAHGAFSTISTALITAAIALCIGLVVGTAPRLMAGPIEVTKATPPVVSGLIVAALMGPSAGGAMIAVLAVSWAPLAAHVAALVTQAKAQPHVQMAPLLGVGPLRLVFRYIMPSVFGPVLGHAALRLPGIALALAALGFLGLGARPPSPEWGLVLAEGMPYLERAPWAVFMPATALVLIAILAVSLASLQRRGF
ncbi:ABC transporter permease subunit [Agrobacterium sp. SORGH_AS 787]|uniref:ABC transporter permease subunit n=1 Tax=Agrobacterium sp. SORGH_AS 787 TaxID=3041775 RepID=UPI0027816720|nr:peptide/nickel transport system permease protein [Rhizobium sp. SORGH_AS_0787]